MSEWIVLLYIGNIYKPSIVVLFVTVESKVNAMLFFWEAKVGSCIFVVLSVTVVVVCFSSVVANSSVAELEDSVVADVKGNADVTVKSKRQYCNLVQNIKCRLCESWVEHF